MPKNISVIDMQGNVYEATYPKRAKGLVKTGRARFVSENTICLACPPDIYLEENKMTNNTNNTVNTTVNNHPTLTAKEIFDQIVILQNSLGSLSHLTEAAQTIYGENSEGDDSAESKTRSIGLLADAFIEREETYRSILSVYDTMYENIATTQTPESVKQAIYHIMDTEMDDGSKLSAIDALLRSEDAV